MYLALEEREIGAYAKAMGLIASFSGRFRNMSFTLHPGDLPNEAPGKSSNEAWAAQKISEDFSMSNDEDNIVVVTMDGELFLETCDM